MNPSNETTIPVALTIAGSDSGGGAGIQADLRTFSFHRVHGTSALTCVTAQNTTGVTRVDALPPEAVIAQIAAVTSDFSVGSAKLGMLLNETIMTAVAKELRDRPITNLVVDPVMVSRSGDKLIDDAAIETLREEILPLADVLTPNIFEAQILTGNEIGSVEDMMTAAKKLGSLGPKSVLIKGGALNENPTAADVWSDGANCQVIETERVETNNTHGSGCTLSAAIAANLALGLEPVEAIIAAKEYVTEALRNSLSIGHGNGPLGHGFVLNEGAGRR
ncbi:MAG: bifunctional hydroxymethylpyrimidine kinase/phosphomethylpyrimidine kinase [Planctomycetaceae bacterium]|nr:bifunctional hydroxymethylpyrimidine kinase/phosphomethylpyrimidine kinase [Planctomycetaceae bacterium]